MKNDLTVYRSLRDQIRPGDVIAFSGNGFIPGAIRFCTHSPISHLGVVFETGEGPDCRIQICESTVLAKKHGVQFNYLSERIEEYDGAALWLPLSAKSLWALDIEKMRAFLKSKDGQPYDGRGLVAFITRAIPGLGLILHHGAAGAWFCSELIAAAFQSGGLVHGLEADEVNPQRICECSIYEKYVQLVGEKLIVIRNFNRL